MNSNTLTNEQFIKVQNFKAINEVHDDTLAENYLRMSNWDETVSIYI